MIARPLILTALAAVALATTAAASGWTGVGKQQEFSVNGQVDEKSAKGKEGGWNGGRSAPKAAETKSGFSVGNH